MEFVQSDAYYSIKRNCGWFEIEKTFESKDKKEVFKLDNAEIQYFLNGKEKTLSDSETLRAMKSLKKELFFAEFPFGMNSQMVHKRHLGEEKIEEINYEKIEFAFVEEQVSKPYLVEGILWLNDQNQPKFIAVAFEDEMEFRKIYDSKKVQGIHFLEYEVYPVSDSELKREELLTQYQEQKLEKINDEVLKDIKVVLGSSSCD